jgi:tRNA A37 threonylcarbamoyladenosine synthetase subunit TsaC/SUA5/YrdC
MPGEDIPVTDAEDIRSQLEKHVDLIIDGGHCGIEPTTVIQLTGDAPEIRRHGKGKDHGLE